MDMQSLKFSFLAFFFFSKYFLVHLVVWGNLETDNRLRRSIYAIPKVFFFFSKYSLVHLVVWGIFETDNMMRRSGFAIPEVFFPRFLLFFLIIFLVDLVVW